MIKKNNTTYKRVNQMNTLYLFILFSAISIAFANDDAAAVAGDKNPFTPKAFVIRYWDKHILNNLPKPSFLLSKASPLSATDTAKFTKLAATNALTTQLPEFCSAAHLLCFSDVMPSLAKHNKNVKFSLYNDGENFTNYSEDRTSGGHSGYIYTYGDGSVSATQTFANYRNQSNAGDESFQFYAKNSRGSAHMDFSNYSKSLTLGTDTFKGYAKGTDLGHKVGFKEYGVNNAFKDYSKEGVSFASYTNVTSSTNLLGASPMKTNATSVTGNLVKRWVEPGKFFRERMLKQGTVMPMPDIRDKLSKRSFLPRSILSKLPFTSSKIFELKRMFKVSDNSSMDKIMMDSLSKCEKAPSMGETKRCVGSLEDMIDFATSALDRNVVVRTTENVNGSKKNVMLGKVNGINGGKVTKSVSCHQSLFPYLLYYCHSVPKVRLYEADLLDMNSKAKINHGVAICHLDTTSWNPTHDAFLALGSGPGRIEVCHWFFENDMTWTVAD